MTKTLRKDASRYLRRLCTLLSAGGALCACAALPRIGGAPLPPAGKEPAPVYRNLADIPEPPPITAAEMNQSTIEALTTDRAKTAQAAQDLRRQPFMQPDPATKPGF